VHAMHAHINIAIEKEMLKKPSGKSLKDCGGDIDFANSIIEFWEKLGDGGSGSRVDRCTVNGMSCAVKILPLESQQPEMVVNFLNEVSIIEHLHHHNIVKYLGHWKKQRNNELWVFMEFYPMNLQEYLERQKGRYLSVLDIVWIAVEIAKGVEFLHTQKPPIIHRDLKGANIMVALQQDVLRTVKIADFDTAKMLYSDSVLQTPTGTTSYMAPEVIDIRMAPAGTPYTLKADVFSFGMLLVEIVTLKPPYFNDVENLLQIAHKVLNGEHPSIYHPQYAELTGVIEIIYQCIQTQPEERPDMPTVLKALKKILKSVVGDEPN